MNSIAQINGTQVSVISFNSVPVITTEQLAGFYGTEPVRIRQNQHENKQRFIEGKHFFKIVGEELKNFASSLKLLTNSHIISNKTRSLILWTERGAARHAKMLDTDQAWEVFEQLEDCYFHRQEILAKTHKSEREPLTNAVNMLVAKTKHLNYSEAYKLVHQRFNVKHIDEIPYDAIPVAVEYVHHLIALYSRTENNNNYEAIETLHKFVERVLVSNDEMQVLCEAVRVIDQRAFMKYSHELVKTNEMARKIAWQYNFKNRVGEPLIDQNCRTVALTTGHRYAVKPNWFNCEA